jgi:RND family efflux transporter MFP subunit
MKRLIRWALGLAALAAVVALGLWVLRENQAEAALERQREEAVKAAAKVSRNAAGEAVVELDRETVERAGIRAEAVAVAEVDPEVVAYGRLQEDPAEVFVLRAPAAGTLRAAKSRSWPTVGEELADGTVAGLLEPRLALAERIALTERLAAARAEAVAARASLTAAQAAHERARTLNADNKNVSDRVLQEAEARLHGEEARSGAALETVRLLEAALRQSAAMPLTLAHGGEVVEVLAQPGESVESGQALLRVARFEKLLARVDVPAGDTVAPGVTSARIVVLGYEERALRGERVALGSSVDPATQGQPFLFRIPTQGLPLRPGLAATAWLRAPGARRKGVIVPRSAVVHTEGRTWVYVRTGEGAFARRAVTLERALEGGWFVPVGLAPGDRVVTAAAQVLLSEESKSRIRVGEGGEAD